MKREFSLVLIRHGHSEWNLNNRFTGWSDIALTETGLSEAAMAGKRLAAEGYGFDEAHISVLQRTRQTIDTLLDAATHAPIPIHTTWRLNERHYGMLQGMNKSEIFAQWGEEESRRWWRGYTARPPALETDDPRHPRFDPRYQGIPLEHLPATESLEDCQRRTLPYWRQTLAPRIKSGQRLIVVSHGNTLRSLIMHLEQLDAAAIEKVEIPSAIPLLFHFDHGLELLAKEQMD